MSRVLIGWELGAGYGHVDGFGGIARALRDAGHEVGFALRDLSRAEQALGHEGFTLHQAPVWLPAAPRELPPPANFAEFLCRFGYLDTQALTGMLKGWHAVYRCAAPDLVLLNHAPTALLAARGQGFGVVRFGTGFECWPAGDVRPGLLPGPTAPAGRSRRFEQHVARVIDSALARTGGPRLGVFRNLFAHSPALLCTLEELDPFREMRAAPEYLGPLVVNRGRARVGWAGRGGPRVLAYLKLEDGRTRRVLHELAAAGVDLLVHVPNLDDAVLDQLRKEGATVVREPIDMAVLKEGCDLLVCHGGHGTVATALLSGCPLLLVPSQGEQLMTASRVEACGAGLYAAPDEGPEGFRRKLEQMLGSTAFGATAQRIAARYGGDDGSAGISAFVHRVEALMARGVKG